MSFPAWFGFGQDEANFLRRVLDHVSDCLVAVDTEGRVVLINAPYCRLLGGEAEDFIGRHITDVVSQSTQLHQVAQGQCGLVLTPLEVRGHKLLARQVPVYQEDRIIGAVGLALFSDLESLKKIAEQVTTGEQAIRSPQTPWKTAYGIDDLIGQGAVMEALRTRIRQAAPLNLPVLIQGETGTGKELAAHAIHTLSARAQRPFVWVNCASIPESLIDAELFGYEGGSFTGARSRGKPGKFELASGGTLFLDEIGDMPLHLQASLLRAVQNQEIVRVGGTAPVKVDVRVICATNSPLEKMVRENRFRADLYFRLNVLSVRMPAVRERDDFDYLVKSLLSRLYARDGAPRRALTPRVAEQLRVYQWPGNVRQLEAALLRYLIAGDLDISCADELVRSGRLGEVLPLPRLGLQEHLERERRSYVARAVQEAGGDKERAAQILGISRATLYRELKEVQR